MNQSVLFAEGTLRRNYRDLQFCPQNNREDLGKSAAHSIGKLKDAFTGFKLMPMRNLANQNLPYLEQLMLPYELSKLEDAFLAADTVSGASATINLDEHLVLKARGKAGDMQDLSRQVRALEDKARDEALPFAWDAQYGYLSYRPLLAGSGYYLNVLLHLPLLHYLKQIRPLSQTLKDMGLMLKPIGKLDTRNPARLFVLSNLSSLDKTDEETNALVQKGIELLVSKEKALQERALNSSGHSTVLDQVWRSYGILRYARRLNISDFLTHWSGLRLGASSGILPLDVKTVDSLLVYGNDQVFQEEGALLTTFVFRRADAVRHTLSGG